VDFAVDLAAIFKTNTGFDTMSQVAQAIRNPVGVDFAHLVVRFRICRFEGQYWGAHSAFHALAGWRGSWERAPPRSVSSVGAPGAFPASYAAQRHSLQHTARGQTWAWQLLVPNNNDSRFGRLGAHDTP
jgi:hypothetical protein